ncbi:MAG TPA: hypothetical protein VLE27_06715, partial [Thermoanaerobaculia bacterium]|nr:hypothetical protein [Thermoanaerobaculia bacterium]
MARSGRQRLGILAVSFDAMGQNILGALVERPGTLHAYLQCCHFIGEPEGEDGKPSWICWTPEAQWNTPDWAPADGGFEAGLEGAVRSMLNVERWQTPGGGLDLLDIVLIQPGPEPASGKLPTGVPEALQRLRRRFKRIG